MLLEMVRLMKTTATLVLGSVLAACASQSSAPVAPPAIQQFQGFTPARPNYQLIPGDELDLSFYGAPEFDRRVPIAPDGRIHLPMIDPIMVADLTIPEARQTVMSAMSQILVDPRLDVVVGTFAPKRVFVGGEVNSPGILEMPGQIDPLQAIIMAGGFTNEARETQVILIRRLPTGEVVNYAFDVKTGWKNPQLANFGPLQRFDVLYVPKSKIAEQNQFIQQYVRNALPIDFSFYYDIAGRSQR